MFKKVIVVFFLIFSAHLGFATDLSFKEKSPIDRLYNESYQGIEQLREEQKFKFDPKLKIAQKDRSYQSLLEQRDENEKSILNHIRPCDINPSAVGCPGHLSWMDNPREFQSMLEQKYKNE